MNDCILKRRKMECVYFVNKSSLMFISNTIQSLRADAFLGGSFISIEHYYLHFSPLNMPHRVLKVRHYYDFNYLKTAWTFNHFQSRDCPLTRFR